MCCVSIFGEQEEKKRENERAEDGERQKEGEKEGFKSPRCHDSETETHKSACPWTPSLFSVLSLVSSFVLSSLHLSLPPSLLLLQHSWEEVEAAVTQLHQDSLSPSAAVALLCAFVSHLNPVFSTILQCFLSIHQTHTDTFYDTTKEKDGETNLFREDINIS